MTQNQQFLPSPAIQNLGIPMHDYQRYAHDFIMTHPYCGLFLTMGLGKAIDDNTIIPTPDGERRLGDIVVGDMLYARDGKPTRVLAVFHHHNRDAFRVTLKDGRSFVCCDEHMIPYQTYSKAATIKVAPLRNLMPDYRQTTSQGYTKYKYRIPMNEPVEMTPMVHIISPYALGILIGDGCLCDSALTISSIDKDVVERTAQELHIQHWCKSKANNHNWLFTKDTNADKVRDELKRLRLKNVKSVNKFIPKEYMHDSIKNRRNLLIGLMDTDGHIHVSHKNNKAANHAIQYTYSTMSMRLAKDVQKLAWSLGYGATLKPYYQDGTLHDIIVSIKCHDILMTCERKCKNIDFKFNTVADKQTPIVDITPVPSRDMTCFTVDSDDHTYLINDYIVTHNTMTTLTSLYDLNPQGNVLVIAPLNIARSTWLDEIEKWHFPFNTVSFLVNENGKKLSKAKRLEAYKKAIDDDRNNKHAIYFINRELVPDIVENCVPWVFPNVVIDESQSFKTYNSKRFKALKSVRPKIERLIELTGTPTPNGLMDLWPQIYLLDEGQHLGKNITAYRNTFFSPGMYVQNHPVNWVPLPGAEQEIYRRIKPLVISMKNTSLKLPPLTINDVKVHMSPDEKKLYDTMKKENVLTIGSEDIMAANAAVLQGKLSQMASGALYTDDDHHFKVIHEQKLEQCDYIIRNTDSPVIVAYHFKSDLVMLLDYLTKAGHDVRQFDGTPNMIHDWNAGKIPVLLIQPASAGHGLNLQQGGHTLIWYTIPWSLEEYQQTNARLYRQGQTEPVVIHHLLTAGTIDTNIIRAINKKDMSQAALMDAVRANL
jgi:SNF2 family DNA or RNA helicase